MTPRIAFTRWPLNSAQSPAAGAPSACVNVAHVRFTWNQQGPIGPTGPQGAAGPSGVLPTNPWNAFQFDNVNGFASKGQSGSGASIGTGARGTILLWYPKLGAFRAGVATGEWDENYIGVNSVAMGTGLLANGSYSTAFGRLNSASGQSSTVLGEFSLATGFASTAMGLGAEARGTASTSMGQATEASGKASTAMGSYTKAGGMYSVALGAAADASLDGSFVFGDGSPRAKRVAPDQKNQFIARAAGGVVFQVSDDGRVGCYLTQGSGGWQCTSDRNQKSGFRAVDGEKLLGSLRALPITTWRYRSDTARTTHLGPTAQDFRSAFSLGPDSVTIGAVDAQGVALAAAKALEARTRILSAEVTELRAQFTALRRVLLETRGVASLGSPRGAQ